MNDDIKEEAQAEAPKSDQPHRMTVNIKTRADNQDWSDIEVTLPNSLLNEFLKTTQALQYKLENAR